MASSTPRKIRRIGSGQIKQTGLGPVRNTSLIGGLIPPKLTPVRASGGPKSPGKQPMPSFGGSKGNFGSRAGLRGTILPLVRGSGGARKVGGKRK